MPSSLIDFRDWTKPDLEALLDLSFQLEKDKPTTEATGTTAALLFFEPSTRTRMSFELACYQESVACTLLTGKVGTSLEKGETAEDTILNVSSMGPDLLVIRTGSDLDLWSLQKKVPQPILNAGWGTFAHPTQALLDVRTLMAKGLPLEKIRILIVGDVKHSRVASSHFELSRKLGYKIAVCSPRVFRPTYDVPVFGDLEEGLEWANVVMTLRFQVERHHNGLQNDDWENYQVNSQRLKAWQNRGWLMHPGPVNYGIELAEDVRDYKQNLILEQVHSGLWLRRACLKRMIR
ncbi:MAG: aspartate carbamoyltransferase [Bdellovibrionales bacterium]